MEKDAMSGSPLVSTGHIVAGTFIQAAMMRSEERAGRAQVEMR